MGNEQFYQVMLPHHVKQQVCETRPKYRDGRKQTAVKVYTVADESQYLLLQGVPSIGVVDELQVVCSAYGEIAGISKLPDFPNERFTNAYLLKYGNIISSRIAKKKLDDYEFYGGKLHICYAPEYESIEETRHKLQERRITIARKCAQNEASSLSDQVQITRSYPPLKNKRHRLTNVSQNLAATSYSNDNIIGAQASDSHQLPITTSHDGLGDNIHLVDLTAINMVSSNDDDDRCSPSYTERIQCNHNVTGTSHEALHQAQAYHSSLTLQQNVKSDSKSLKRNHTAAEAAIWSAETFVPAKTVPNKTYREAIVIEEQPSIKVSKYEHDSYRDHIVSLQPDLTSGQPLILHRPDVIKSEKPRFVPRQLGTLMKSAAMKAHETVVINSASLGKVQGPSIPQELEASLRETNRQRTVDETTLDIRKKVYQ